MALDGQVSYLSTEYQEALQRLQTPTRRSPDLRINGEEISDGRTASNLGMRAPIIGYEVVDERQKFTVYKIEVKGPSRSWFVFRRYSDFMHLNDRLKEAYPNFQIRLPGKRWFKDNFDPEFIEERARGLQFFINNVMDHSQICQSDEVQVFFCLNDPPGPYDSLEESRAYCQHLETQVDDLKQKVDELTAELKMTKSQLLQARVQQDALVSALRKERASRKKRSASDSKRNSPDIDGLLEQSEKMANIEGLKGKVYQLLQSSNSNSIGKMAAPDGGGSEEDKVLWNGRVDIAEHSNGTGRMRPSRRLSQGRQSPLTSTPVSNSDRSDSPRYLDDSPVVETRKEIKESDKAAEATKLLNSADVALAEPIAQDSEKEKNYHHGNLKTVADVESRKHTNNRNVANVESRNRTNNRDSGISVDTSPTPST